MALTKTAEIELLNVINGYNNNDKQSSILPNPKFRRITTTTFLTDINNKLGVTDAKIVGLHHNKDIVVVVANYASNSKGVLAYYNPQFNIYEILSQFNTGVVDSSDNEVYKDFYPFKETKLNRQNFLYGLCEKDGKTNFFLTSDLMESVGVLDSSDFIQESFYSSLFDIESEIINDPDDPKKVLDPKVGNALFGDYEKIGFNQDAFDNDLYSFVLWKDNGQPSVPNEIEYVKFTAELSQQTAITSDWQINGVVSLAQGVNDTGSDFKNISSIAALSGEQTLSKTETSLGSIMFSTQEDTKQTAIPQFSTKIGTTTAVSSHFTTVATPLSNAQFIFANQTNFFDVWLAEIQKILQQQLTDVDYSVDIKIKTKLPSTNDVEFTLTKTQIDEIFQFKNKTLEADGTVTYINDSQRKIDVKYRIYLSNDGDPAPVNLLVKSYEEIIDATKPNNNSSDAVETSFGAIKLVAPTQTGIFPFKFTWSDSVDVTVSGVVSGKRNEQIIIANTTSQIIVETIDDKPVYKIVVSETNSYEGTEAVFESPRKFFVPLKKKDTMQYYVYEFNGEIGTTPTLREFNDIGLEDFSDASGDNYKAKLLSPTSIQEVLKNNFKLDELEDFPNDTPYTYNGSETGTPLSNSMTQFKVTLPVPISPAKPVTVKADTVTILDSNISIDYEKGIITFSQDNIKLINPPSASVEIEYHENQGKRNWELVGEVLNVYGIKEGDNLKISYNTIIGVPKAINLTTTTSGDDIFIAGIQDSNELSNTGISIVGAGDNSLNGSDPSTVFGFNLYRSKPNIDYDSIAEKFEDLDFKVKHVKAYRQKNLLYIFAYNEDYTQVVEWTQIYPDSFKPYTYLPYANPDLYFTLERFNQNKQYELKNSVFDREFLDIGTSGNTLLGSTQAENTDLNDNDNDSTTIFGHTNEPLFQFDGTIIKGRNEVRSLQFTLNSNFIDKIQDKELYSETHGELLTKLFGKKNADAHNLVALGDAVLTFTDGTKATRPATDFTTVNEADRKIEVGIFLVDINKTKTPESLSFYNKNGDLLINIDLTIIICDTGKSNINFDILISENADGIRYDYAKLDFTGYDKPYEPITTAKGGK